MSTHEVIAIDGPVGSGKSTVAKLVARRLGYARLDTGAIYRSLALLAREQGIGWEDEDRLAELALGLPLAFVAGAEGQRVSLAGRDVTAEIRTPEISRGASVVSRHPRVRQRLLELQRAFAMRGPLVAEGRDMTTVVFPDAAVKVYLDASVEERARRRHEELQAADDPSSFEQVLAAARERDEADRSRAVAPLTVAPDAHHLDTTGLTLEQVVERVVALRRC